MPSQWICCQIGAREHYAVPRVLYQNRQLTALFTDFWAGPLMRRLSQNTQSAVFRSLGTRFHPELNGASVTSWNARSLWSETVRRRRRTQNTIHGPYLGFVEVGRQFATRVRAQLEKRVAANSRAIFFSYDTGALEALEWCRAQGLPSIVNQMDPNRVETDLVRAEEKCWPGWNPLAIEVPEGYFQRREREWALADRVLVNSEFCREALVRQGVSPEKLVVVPLSYELVGQYQKPGDKNPKSPGESPSSVRPLRVLFLGQVILRKGIQYLMQAARLLEKENIQFDIVGPLGITPDAIHTAPRNLIFHGRTARDQANAWYRQSDVFVLPTLSDGFAITQIEAMANGLPVITTPNCGQVVADGVDGFIVPARDAGALAAVFLRYLTEPGLLRCQSESARKKAGQFSLDRLAHNLGQLEAGLMKGRVV